MHVKNNQTRVVRAYVAIFLIAGAATYLGTAERRAMEWNAITRRFPRISGDDEFKHLMALTLNMLAEKDPRGFETVATYLRVIVNQSQNGVSPQWSPTLASVGSTATSTSATWCGGVLVHEACHAKYFHDRFPHSVLPVGTLQTPDGNRFFTYGTNQEEMDCIYHQARALRLLNAPACEIDFARHLNANYWDHNHDGCRPCELFTEAWSDPSPCDLLNPKRPTWIADAGKYQ